MFCRGGGGGVGGGGGEGGRYLKNIPKGFNTPQNGPSKFRTHQQKWRMFRTPLPPKKNTKGRKYIAMNYGLVKPSEAQLC